MSTRLSPLRHLSFKRIFSAYFDGIEQQLGLLALLLMAYGLRLHALTRQNIWWDEARNIEVALRPFGQIAFAPELDIQPPLYFWLLHGWGQLMGVEMGMDPAVVAFTARYLSVAAGIIGCALLYALTSRIGGSRAGLIALSLGALSPLWLAESQETRMYTLSFAFLTAAALALMVVEERKLKTSMTGPRLVSHRRPILYASFVLLSTLALATHYNAVFILVAWYIWWGIVAVAGVARWQHLRTVILCGLAMTALLLPLAPIALRQIPTYANPNLTVPSIVSYLRQNWIGFLGGYAADAVPGIDLWAGTVLALLAAGIAIGVWQLRIGRRPVAEERLSYSALHPSRMTGYSFLLSWFLGGLALYYIAVLDRGAFNLRYSSFVTPALYALLGIGLAGLGRLQRWLPVAGLALLLLGLIPAVRADLTDPRFFREDTAGLAAWLRAETGPGDLILVDQKYPFGFYYNRYAIAPDTTPTGAEAAPARYLFVDINTVDQWLSGWAGSAERVFWVQWFESDTDPRGAVSFLLDQYGVRAGERNFQGYWVRWWTLTPPTEFALATGMEPQIHRWRGGLETVEISTPLSALAGENYPVVIRWGRAAGQINRALKARIALYNADGGRLVQDDRRILNDRHLAPAEWRDADRPLNVYQLPLPADLPGGSYSLKLLVYDAETLDPVEVVDEAGNGAGIEVEIGRLEIAQSGE